MTTAAAAANGSAEEVGRPRPRARGSFLGWQARVRGRPVALFRLDEVLGPHPIGSALSGYTIRAAGYDPPPVPCVGRDCRQSAVWVTYVPGLDLESLDAAAWCDDHGRPLASLGVLVSIGEALEA